MEHDWSGSPLTAPLSWCFARDPKTLWFVASLPGGQCFDAHHAQGEFVEGLWERDVAEFFVKDRSGRYQEFNVSPAGAWWTAVLSSYRTREEITPKLHVSAVEVTIQDGMWTALLGVAHAGLAVALDSDSLVHVSGIVHKPGRQFLSSQPVAAIEPDFHHPDAFQVVGLRDVP